MAAVFTFRLLKERLGGAGKSSASMEGCGMSGSILKVYDSGVYQDSVFALSIL